MTSINENFVGPERTLMVAATLTKRYVKRTLSCPRMSLNSFVLHSSSNDGISLLQCTTQTPERATIVCLWTEGPRSRNPNHQCTPAKRRPRKAHSGDWWRIDRAPNETSKDACKFHRSAESIWKILRHGRKACQGLSLIFRGQERCCCSERTGAFWNSARDGKQLELPTSVSSVFRKSLHIYFE